MLEKEGCKNYGNIPEEYPFVFNITMKTNRSKKVTECANKIAGARFIDSTMSTTGISAYFYITFQSTFFGFIDDMFIELTGYGNVFDNLNSLRIQS